MVDQGMHGDEEETARRLIASWLAGTEDEGGAGNTTGPADATTRTAVPGGAAGGPAGGARAGGPVPSGLAVPPAGAREVVSTARRLAIEGLAGEPWPVPPADLRLIAEALVVDEHPSAASWSAGERAELGRWIAVLMHRFGEDGVQRLVAALAGPR
ncbi:hypothetical protein [Kitasatospora sp. NPDC094015]|uniref:hypothetical protein n=1 Tax=Kitasatospora sp. NPDC094015 TaxID=3155205 RepID=UPI003321A9E6